MWSIRRSSFKIPKTGWFLIKTTPPPVQYQNEKMPTSQSELSCLKKNLRQKITLHKSSAWNLDFSEYSLWKDLQWEKNEIYCLNESVYTNLEKTASKHTVRSSSILFFFHTLKSTNKKKLCWHTYSFCPNTSKNSDGLLNWASHSMIACTIKIWNRFCEITTLSLYIIPAPVAEIYFAKNKLWI